MATKVMYMEEGTDKTLTVFENGESLVATSTSHANFDEIYRRVVEEKASLDDVRSLFDRVAAAEAMFEAFSDRVAIRNGQVFFDLDPVDNALTKKVVEFIDQGLEDDAQALVNFFEKVMANPQEHSREQLYRWLERHNFPITPTGDIVAYKGVEKVGDKYLSIHSGTAVVNGKTITGRIPQKIGDVVEMPRSAVQHDPSVGCHTGLHAGTFEYASSFGRGVTLEVHISPTDVVSVPTDCDDQKVRVCRYAIAGEREAEYTTAFVDDNDFEEDDEDWYEGDDEDYVY